VEWQDSFGGVPRHAFVCWSLRCGKKPDVNGLKLLDGLIFLQTHTADILFIWISNDVYKQR
jgi:hypothetical protein